MRLFFDWFKNSLAVVGLSDVLKSKEHILNTIIVGELIVPGSCLRQNWIADLDSSQSHWQLTVSYAGSTRFWKGGRTNTFCSVTSSGSLDITLLYAPCTSAACMSDSSAKLITTAPKPGGTLATIY